MIVNTREIKAGQKFKHNNSTWICTSNDGFIFSADNTDEKSSVANMMFIGMSEDVELID